MLPLRNALRRTGEVVVETVYPRRCAACGRRGQWVCEDCDRQLRRFTLPWCERCGAPPTLAPCRCAELTPSLSVIRSAALDEGWLGHAIRSFKYAGETARTDHLSEMLVPLIEVLPEFDALVPVPLHRLRRRKRGYNQAHLMATAVSRASSVQVLDALVRHRATAQQVGLNAEARRANVLEAFAVRDNVEVVERRFVLVDDVLTTGSTLGQCADTLVAAGAAWVGALTLAREA
jgi:ComF family protein